MSPPAPPTTGRVIFVGNIPYGLTEEQITEIFSSAGRVLSFRLVYDRETGRPKGFGFAEYPDPETAASAVRNLDNYEIMGRKLRVDFSHEGNTPPPDADGGRGGGGGGIGSGLQQGQSLDLPRGTELPPGLTAPDAISQTMKAFQVPQLLDILHQMKTLVTSDPAKATQLLREAPQLSYAVFQALLLMNLVDAGVLTQVIETAAAAAPPPPAPAVVAPPPPVVPPVQAPTPVQPAATPVMDPNQAALIQQVMRLTDDQLAALAPEHRQQILMLRAQFMGVV